ncbi:MAG TPA: CDP-alcohol phosphatidyltransferase family protein, partial [Allosphingosinicella sp.]|nr:CDP-alcohol phosphatidyltransferase family protein [Allosphingosinicella sp.]
LAAGYVVQRLVEGMFILRFKIDIHVWKKPDSTFRLVTARRNPNMVILFAALLLGYPDYGLLAVATWTILSCAFHVVRLIQAEASRSRGSKVESWLQ